MSYGSFLVNEITTAKDTGITTIVAYDKMINSMVKYQPLEIEYPIGLYDYTVALCEECNLELQNQSFNILNNWQITKDLWANIDGVTYRDIFQQIAQVTCTTAMISNNKLYFKSLTNTNEDLTYDNMKTLKLEPIYGEINKVILGRDPIIGEDVFLEDSQSIAQNGLTEWRIDNNEIVDKNRESAITPIYNGMHGINFYPFETTTEGLGWYEIADNITIEIDNGDTFNVSLFNFSITIDGGIKEILKTNAETKTQSQYQYASSISKRIKNTEIIVNKQEQTITAVVEDMEDVEGRMTEVEQTVDGITTTVEQVVETVSQYDEDIENAQLTADNATTEARNAQAYAETSNSNLSTQLGYANDELQSIRNTIQTMNTTFEQSSTSFTATINTIVQEIERTNEQVTQNETTQSKYLRYYNDPNNDNKGTLELGESDSPLKVKITNEEMAFTESGNKVAYINGNKLFITTAEVLNALIIGNFGFTPLSNGSLTFGKIR